MKIVVESERLILREFLVDDAEDIFELNNDPEVLRYTGDPPFASIEDAYLFLQNYRSNYTAKGMGRWFIITKWNMQNVGWCGLRLQDNGVVDLGYRLRKSTWGKGIATEASKMALEYGFKELKINQVIARAQAANIGSIKVMEKLRMTFTENIDFDGVPGVVYTITKEQFNLL